MATALNQNGISRLPETRMDAFAKSTFDLGVEEAQLERERMAINERSATFKPNVFNDIESRNVLKSIGRIFKKTELAKNLIMREAERMRRYANDRLMMSSDTCTYKMLLDNFIMKGESFFDENGFNFDYIDFLDEIGKEEIEQPMMQGKMFLTDSRLILISCEQIKGTILSNITTPSSKRSEQTYEISSYHNDELHYKFIKFHDIAHIEFHSRIGSRVESEVRYNDKTKFFKLAKWKRYWRSSRMAPEGKEYSEKVMVISCILKPFDDRCLMNVHVDDKIKLERLTEFVSFMQRNCLKIKDMVPRFMTNGEVNEFKKMYDCLPLKKEVIKVVDDRKGDEEDTGENENCTTEFIGNQNNDDASIKNDNENVTIDYQEAKYNVNNEVTFIASNNNQVNSETDTDIITATKNDNRVVNEDNLRMQMKKISRKT